MGTSRGAIVSAVTSTGADTTAFGASLPQPATRRATAASTQAPMVRANEGMGGPDRGFIGGVPGEGCQTRLQRRACPGDADLVFYRESEGLSTTAPARRGWRTTCAVRSCSPAAVTMTRAKLPTARLAGVRDPHDAVDLGRVGRAARDRASPSSSWPSTSTVSCRPTRARSRRALIARLHGHEARAPLLLHRLGHRVGQRVGRGAVDRRIREAADAVELRCLEEREQLVELALGLAGKADDERAADREVGARRAPGPDARQRVSRRWPDASSASGCAGSRAGTARRGRAAGRPLPDRPSSAGSRRRRADTGRRSAGAPTRRACAPARRARSRARSSASSPAGPCQKPVR